jgi:hypothetical protein
MVVYQGKCARCNASKGSAKFMGRRAGHPVNYEWKAEWLPYHIKRNHQGSIVIHSRVCHACYIEMQQLDWMAEQHELEQQLQSPSTEDDILKANSCDSLSSHASAVDNDLPSSHHNQSSHDSQSQDVETLPNASITPLDTACNDSTADELSPSTNDCGQADMSSTSGTQVTPPASLAAAAVDCTYSNYPTYFVPLYNTSCTSPADWARQFVDWALNQYCAFTPTDSMLIAHRDQLVKMFNCIYTRCINTNSCLCLAGTHVACSSVACSSVAAAVTAPVNVLAAASHVSTPSKRKLSDSNMTKSKKRCRYAHTIDERSKFVDAIEALEAITDRKARAEKRKQLFESTNYHTWDVRNFKISVNRHRAMAKEARAGKRAKRLAGGGAKTSLSEQQERSLKEWILSLRRGPLQLQVSRKDVQLRAYRVHGRALPEGVTVQEQEEWKKDHVDGFEASDSWLAGFFERNGMSLRKRTTTKTVNTPAMQRIAAEYRRHVFELLAKTPRSLIINMDESPIYLDCPSLYTIDEKNADTVEIGTSKHERDRVTVVSAVDAAGGKVHVLVIHRLNETAQVKRKTNQIFRQTVKVDKKEVVDGCDKVIRTQEDITVWYTYTNKAYMNQTIMQKWLRLIYLPYTNQLKSHEMMDAVLIMDGMGSHKSDIIKEEIIKSNLNIKILPPNQTPNLQPLDHSINHLFKLAYGDEWFKWWAEAESRELTKEGNHRKASVATVNGWVARAMSRITKSQILNSWQHTLMLKPCLRLMPDNIIDNICSFIGGMSTESMYLKKIRHLHDGNKIKMFKDEKVSKKKSKAQDTYNLRDFTIYEESGRSVKIAVKSSHADQQDPPTKMTKATSTSIINNEINHVTNGRAQIASTEPATAHIQESMTHVEEQSTIADSDDELISEEVIRSNLTTPRRSSQVKMKVIQ